MRHLKKFNESSKAHPYEDIIDMIIDSMRDFLDDDRYILFKSSMGDMRYQDYINKTSKYFEFSPIINSHNFERGDFKIVFHDVKDYPDLTSIISQMQSVLSILKEEDWTMYDMKVVTSPPPGNQGDARFIFLSYSFSNPDKLLDGDFKWPEEYEFTEMFSKNGLSITSFDYPKESSFVRQTQATEVIIYFESISFQGKVDHQACEEFFELVCNRFGFSSFSYDWDRDRVTFEV